MHDSIAHICMNMIPPPIDFTSFLFGAIMPYAVATLMLLLSVELEFGICVAEGVAVCLGSKV